MTQVMACIDGSQSTRAVCDYAAWASQRLSAPLTLLHVLDEVQYPTRSDLSGAIGLGSREHLLEELASLDQQRHKLAMEQGRLMLEAARERFAAADCQATFIQAPFQQLPALLEQPFDLVLCHAVLEWLAEPASILPVLQQLTATEGWLSLAFYNRDALIYRNLLKGHFRKLRKQSFAGEGQSLTPQQPLDPRELDTLMQDHWHIQARSGVRVFHDYMPAPFQAQASLEDLLEMELAYRRHPAFAGLGRYLHWICRPHRGGSS